MKRGTPDPIARIETLQFRWQWHLRISGLLRGLGAGSPFLAVAIMGQGFPTALRILVGGVAVTAMAAVVHTYFTRAARISPETIALHLDRTVPAMEESAELLLIPENQLSLVATLQRARITKNFADLDASRFLPRSPVTASMGLVAISLGVTLVIVAGGGRLLARTSPEETTNLSGAGLTASEAPAIGDIRIRIVPPAYTRLPERESESLDVAVEEGAGVSWKIQVSGQVDGAVLVFEDGEISMDGTATEGFAATLTAEESRIYRLVLSRNEEVVVRSAHARIEVIPDTAPDISILGPAGNVKVGPEEGSALVLEVEVQDDYGLIDAELVTTLATGSGEIVQFRQKHQSLGSAIFGTRQLLSHVIDLEELGMTPGSELYLHVEARDNRQPEPNTGRSSAMTISMPGAGNPSVAMDSGIPILAPPEFLRSQRQIILDTERLIAQQESLRTDEFQYRSQAIGRDQSLLRVRYGSLMGEEVEDGRAVGVDDESAEHAETEGKGRAGSSMASIYPEELTHLHDSEESAAFFPDPVRRSFRAMLEQMWGAEGLLRTYSPDEALPLEYEALRLLKSIQEQSRIYVQKVGFESSPLKPEEDRFSGDLSEIEDQDHHRRGLETLPASEIRRALTFIRSLARGPTPLPGDLVAVLVEARSVLGVRALASSELNLQVLDLLANLLDGEGEVEIGEPDRIILERALWSLLPRPLSPPGSVGETGGALYEAYRRRLGENR
jgi:hypothetical protein